MKTYKSFFYALLAFGLLGLCSCGSKVKWPALPIEEATPYFADAAKTKTIDTAFYEIKDAKGNTLGTILFSSPYSDGVKGFNGPTPLLIALDAEGRIMTVALLGNEETPASRSAWWKAVSMKHGTASPSTKPSGRTWMLSVVPPTPPTE